MKDFLSGCNGKGRILLPHADDCGEILWRLFVSIICAISPQLLIVSPTIRVAVRPIRTVVIVAIAITIVGKYIVPSVHSN